MRFSSLAFGNRYHPYPVWAPALLPVILSGGISPQKSNFFMCMHWSVLSWILNGHPLQFLRDFSVYGFFSSTLVNSIHLGLLGLSTKRPLDLPEFPIPALPNSRYLAGAFIELPLFDFLSLRTSLPDAHCVENSCFMYFVCSLFSGSRVNLGLVAPS